MNEATYRKRLADAGFHDIEVLQWSAGRFNDTHSHPHTARAYILSGTLTVECESGTTSCGAGEAFTLGPNIPHTERAGPDGVRFVFGKKT